MTNTKKLEEAVKNSGYKRSFVAKELGISSMALFNKMKGKTAFKVPEMQKLCVLLNLSPSDRESIFFADCVDF